MGFPETFVKLSDQEILTYILFIASLILPGVAYLFVFQGGSEFINTLNPTSLVLISILISFPFLIIGLLHWTIKNNYVGKKITTTPKVKLQIIFHVGLFTIVSVTVSVLSYYLIKNVVDSIFGKNYYLFLIIIALSALLVQWMFSFKYKYLTKENNILILISIFIILLMILVMLYYLHLLLYQYIYALKF